MGNTTLVFDHVHLISTDPHTTASWYADNLGGTIIEAPDGVSIDLVHRQ
jgi:hypothetical protein